MNYSYKWWVLLVSLCISSHSLAILLNGFLFTSALCWSSSLAYERSSSWMCLYFRKCDRLNGIALHQGTDNIRSARCLKFMEWFSLCLHVARSRMQFWWSKCHDLWPIITGRGRFFFTLYREPLLPKKNRVSREQLPWRDPSEKSAACSTYNISILGSIPSKVKS